MENLIESKDRFKIEALAAQSEQPTMRRAAQILLLYDEGQPTGEIASRVGLSPSRTRFWRRRFAALGMAMFSDAALQDEAPVHLPDGDESNSQAEIIPDRISWDELRQRYPANLRRAEHRRDLALILFDGTQTMHQLGEEYRRLLETATLIRYLEEIRDEEKVDTSGYFFILTHPQTEVDEAGLKLVSAVLEYQAKKSDRKALKNLDTLLDYQRTALSLAAILRIAFGLDDSNSQETEISEVESQPGLLRVFIEGPKPRRMGAPLTSKPDYGHTCFNRKSFSTWIACKPARKSSKNKLTCYL
jgi:hypothetical protein